MGEYLRVLARQIRPTQGVRAARSHGFQGAMLSRNPATHGQILTGSGRSDRSALQGRDEERAFPVRTRNGQDREAEARPQLHRQAPHERRGRKKEAWRGEPWAGIAASRKRHSLYPPFLSSGSGAALLRRAGPSALDRLRGQFLDQCAALRTTQDKQHAEQRGRWNTRNAERKEALAPYRSRRQRDTTRSRDTGRSRGRDRHTVQSSGRRGPGMRPANAPATPPAPEKPKPD
jgi:hypothetical protein